MPDPNRIKEHWNQVAENWRTDPKGAMPDGNLRHLEFDAVTAHVNRDEQVLDIGCGNGFYTLRLAQQTTGLIVGCDFSPPMIAQARALLATEEAAIQKRVRFEVADVTTLPFIERFTKVVSFRCLINLPSDEMQAKALARIATMLEPGGQALLSEDTSQGYDAINALRLSLGLPQMERRWHNNPIDEALVREICPSIGLVVEEIWDFSSSYYMISRAVNPLLAREIKFGKDFIPELDAIARQLPAVGNFGLLRLIRLRKTK